MQNLLEVDTAVVVPVNVLPLIDDTNFKAIEEAVAYDAAGMDLNWNFIDPSDGSVSQTNVVPTTSGIHDWLHAGNGMYNLEIPASAGTINNDTEGYGWFSGVATGVLPWAGPMMTFGPQNVVNSLVLDTEKLIVASPDLLQSTTLATVASQGQFTLTAGSPDDDVYNGRICIVTDQVTSEQKGVMLGKDYTGSSKTLIVHEVPQFTVAVGDGIDILAVGDSTLYALDRSTANIIDIVESQRGAHTKQGNQFYWDPENGNDTNDGLTHSTAKATFASAYSLVVANNHDVVHALAGAAAGKTVTTETIVMDKEYSFLRHPGRDFRYKPTVTNADTVVLSAEGAEFFGAIVETAESGSRDAISIAADFVRTRAWVDQSRGDGVHVEDANNCLVDVWVQDAGEGGSGHGIHVRSTSNPTTRNTICGNVLDTTGDGIRFDGAQCTNNFITVNGNGTQIIGSSGWGVNEVNSADFNFVVGPGIFFANNTSGDVNLTGANSAKINVEQWAKQSGTVVGTMSVNSLAQVNTEMDTAISDAALATAVNLATIDSNVDSLVTDMASVIATLPLIRTNPVKGVAFDMQFLMVDAATGLVAQTGLTVALTIRKDSGAFVAATNSIAEVGNGWYEVTLTATEMNSNVIIGAPTATDAVGGFQIVTDS